ncbi:methionine ABC transporter ATP-binding protein [Rothia sp. HMSC058E10]|uniref:Methionine ABC transporter ATP-binding protein n=2 Tax=Rothia dentocariosa TaxID=2047 RepID=A0A269YJ56_9MICC|nr:MULTISPECIES: methionine ABC transporter ATP-binding protein [Rothia]ADP40054.1 ABC transporter, ATP-binding protein [Rothia dentocariosa ATCC 17931]OFN18035.1 methionine ABC transporter ATP-binding protein [Rothia sp. HMSC058E10]OFQ04537.1 methionine ABC transporter ATP-binding protein [Rothia sp. HMSC036D11]PAK85588.1 methionine ABC transporter ATP-binding protein [Rothia dentocariosa]PEN15705.1 methionine ABC transporter ATP-binding protein [Rothia dentocariosa]
MSEQAAPWAKNPEPGATTPKGTNTLISPGAADTGAEPMVTIDNVSKIFGKGKKEVAAVKNVSLTVKKGEIFAIIGYSGAGKSTLVRLINGLESTTSGTLTVDGFEISGKRDLELQKVRTNIGMIFQQFNLMNSRTVAQNVEFPLKVAGWSKGERTKRVQEMLEFVGLADRAKYYPSQLSGGQKQRVGIARALATKPSLLLADEATSALDPETTHEVLELLKEVNRELGITVIVITHEMDVVSSIADRVAVMEEGRVVETGSVYEVFSNPQTEVAQRFVATTVKQSPTGDAAAALRKNHKGYLVNVEIVEGNQELGKILAYLGSRNVRFNIVHGGIETLQGKAYGTLTLELLGDVTSIDAAVAELKTVTRVQEVR